MKTDSNIKGILVFLGSSKLFWSSASFMTKYVIPFVLEKGMNFALYTIDTFFKMLFYPVF